MSYRFMRVLVFFDLPVVTAEERKIYRDFRKMLIRSGFMMMQESVYCKIVLNMSSASTLVGQIKAFRPKEGLVQILTVTEKQFARIETITGEMNEDIINSDKRVIVL